MADINGNPPRKDGSCVLMLKGDKAGFWHDHSTGKGGGPLSTLKMATGLEGRELLDRAAEIIGATPAKANGEANGHGNIRQSDDKKGP